jgi:hypothetical protein
MMRAVLLGAVAAALLAATSANGAGALKVTLNAPTHTPRNDGSKWPYAVHATVNGKAAAARLTVQIVDPIGGIHPVELGDTKTKLVNRRFTGVFRDFVRWNDAPAGVPLTFRVTVVSGAAKKVIDYRVVPHA